MAMVREDNGSGDGDHGGCEEGDYGGGDGEREVELPPAIEWW